MILFAKSAAFSPLAISLCCGYEHDITSTELLRSTRRTASIHEDPDAASRFPLLENSLPPFFPPTRRFISKAAPYAPMCVSRQSVENVHTNYCGAKS